MKNQRDNDPVLQELKEIKETLARIEASCSTMDSHVDFVEVIYERVHAPFSWMMNKIRNLSGIGGEAICLQKLKNS